jgi:hypothetical protein
MNKRIKILINKVQEYYLKFSSGLNFIYYIHRNSEKGKWLCKCYNLDEIK